MTAATTKRRRPRRTALMRRAGPYRVVNHVNGMLTVYPTYLYEWGKPSWRRRTQEDQEVTGGPGLFSRYGLAEDLETYLNGPYHDHELATAAQDDDLTRDKHIVTTADLRHWLEDPDRLAAYLDLVRDRDPVDQTDQTGQDSEPGDTESPAEGPTS